MRNWFVFLSLWLLSLALPRGILAAPYYFISGSSQMISGYLYHYYIYLYTGTDTLTATQTVLNFDKNLIQKLNVNTIGSRCSFWVPADPSMEYGNQTTPYYYEDNKLVIACGFSNPGYKSTGSQGDLIATIQLTPVASISGSTSLYFSNTLFRYIGNTITPGTNVDLDVTVYASTAAASPSITPQPSATSATNTRTITSSDLHLLNLASNSANVWPTLTAQQMVLWSQVPTPNRLADEIPPQPILSLRPTEAPLGQLMDKENEKQKGLGEVLSIQSLKELLLPGKSIADQKIVLVNLISTSAFIIILTILIWRLIIISRMNKIKYRHLKELLSGELSTLESKLTADISEEKREDLNQRMEEIRKKLES